MPIMHGMAFERNTDLPAELRSGLPAEQQTIVRGLMNALIYERDMNPVEAAQVATQVLQSSGMVYDGGWKTVAKNDAVAAGVITKVDEDKRLVFGWASIIKDVEGRVLLDRQDDYIDDEGELEKSAYTYVLNSRDGGEMHVRKGVSTMVESVVLTKEKQAALGIPEGVVPVGWWIGFRVNDDRVWNEVKKGGYVGFSVHGTGHRNQSILKEGEYTEVEKRDMTEPEKMMKPRRKVRGEMVSKSELIAKTKAMKAKIEAMQVDEADDMDSMMECPECGEEMEKGEVCKCGYSDGKMQKGDYRGHPFRGNQHTGGKGRGKKPSGGGAGKGERLAEAMKPSKSGRMSGGRRANQQKPGESRQVVGRTRAGISEGKAPKSGSSFKLKVKGRDVDLKWGKSSSIKTNSKTPATISWELTGGKSGNAYGKVTRTGSGEYMASGKSGKSLQGTFSSAEEAALAIMRRSM